MVKLKELFEISEPKDNINENSKILEKVKKIDELIAEWKQKIYDLQFSINSMIELKQKLLINIHTIKTSQYNKNLN